MVFTDAGVQNIIDFLSGAGAVEPTHIAVGTDNSSPTKNDTAIITEVIRKAIESTTSDSVSVTFSVIVLSTEGNGNSLKEVGLINSATGGELYNRFTHAAIDKTQSYELEYEITIQVAN